MALRVGATDAGEAARGPLGTGFGFLRIRRHLLDVDEVILGGAAGLVPPGELFVGAVALILIAVALILIAVFSPLIVPAPVLALALALALVIATVLALVPTPVATSATPILTLLTTPALATVAVPAPPVTSPVPTLPIPTLATVPALSEGEGGEAASLQPPVP